MPTTDPITGEPIDDNVVLPDQIVQEAQVEAPPAEEQTPTPTPEPETTPTEVLPQEDRYDPSKDRFAFDPDKFKSELQGMTEREITDKALKDFSFRGNLRDSVTKGVAQSGSIVERALTAADKHISDFDPYEEVKEGEAKVLVGDPDTEGDSLRLKGKAGTVAETLTEVLPVIRGREAGTYQPPLTREDRLLQAAVVTNGIMQYQKERSREIDQQIVTFKDVQEKVVTSVVSDEIASASKILGLDPTETVDAILADTITATQGNKFITEYSPLERQRIEAVIDRTSSQSISPSVKAEYLARKKEFQKEVENKAYELQQQKWVGNKLKKQALDIEKDEATIASIAQGTIESKEKVRQSKFKMEVDLAKNELARRGKASNDLMAQKNASVTDVQDAIFTKGAYVPPEYIDSLGLDHKPELVKMLKAQAKINHDTLRQTPEQMAAKRFGEITEGKPTAETLSRTQTKEIDTVVEERIADGDIEGAISAAEEVGGAAGVAYVQGKIGKVTSEAQTKAAELAKEVETEGSEVYKNVESLVTKLKDLRESGKNSEYLRIVMGGDRQAQFEKISPYDTEKRLEAFVINRLMAEAGDNSYAKRKLATELGKEFSDARAIVTDVVSQLKLLRQDKILEMKAGENRLIEQESQRRKASSENFTRTFEVTTAPVGIKGANQPVLVESSFGLDNVEQLILSRKMRELIDSAVSNGRIDDAVKLLGYNKDTNTFGSDIQDQADYNRVISTADFTPPPESINHMYEDEGVRDYMNRTYQSTTEPLPDRQEKHVVYRNENRELFKAQENGDLQSYFEESFRIYQKSTHAEATNRWNKHFNDNNFMDGKSFIQVMTEEFIDDRDDDDSETEKEFIDRRMEAISKFKGGGNLIMKVLEDTPELMRAVKSQKDSRAAMFAFMVARNKAINNEVTGAQTQALVAVTNPTKQRLVANNVKSGYDPNPAVAIDQMMGDLQQFLTIDPAERLAFEVREGQPRRVSLGGAARVWIPELDLASATSNIKDAGAKWMGDMRKRTMSVDEATKNSNTLGGPVPRSQWSNQLKETYDTEVSQYKKVESFVGRVDANDKNEAMRMLETNKEYAFRATRLLNRHKNGQLTADQFQYELFRTFNEMLLRSDDVRETLDATRFVDEEVERTKPINSELQKEMLQVLGAAEGQKFDELRQSPADFDTENVEITPSVKEEIAKFQGVLDDPASTDLEKEEAQQFINTFNRPPQEEGDEIVWVDGIGYIWQSDILAPTVPNQI